MLSPAAARFARLFNSGMYSKAVSLKRWILREKFDQVGSSPQRVYLEPVSVDVRWYQISLARLQEHARKHVQFQKVIRTEFDHSPLFQLAALVLTLFLVPLLVFLRSCNPTCAAMPEADVVTTAAFHL